MARIVWIIGAGFSRSLGAPLLGDLFSHESARRIGFYYGPQLRRLAIEPATVSKIYWYGAYGFPHSSPIERRWEHAEEFVEQLALVCLDDSRKRWADFRAFLSRIFDKEWPLTDAAHREREVDRITARQMSDLHSSALTMIAAEVCCFLENTDTKQERWQPFVQWVQSLTADDTVLTFNYDRVLELCGENRSSPLHVVTPYELANPPREAVDERPQAPWSFGPTVYKLHGSVDWCNVDGEFQEALGDDALRWAVGCDPHEIAIATPGPGKSLFTGKDGPLATLWAHAARAVQAAEAVVFIGYRMPPTDVSTLTWLTEQLRNNSRRLLASPERDAPYRGMPSYAGPDRLRSDNPLRVHTVLGDDVTRPDSRRLRGVLEAIGPRGTIEVTQWPMFATDFLATVNREGLT